MLNVIVIAGPNGAGKSTLAPALLRDTLGIFEYVNADTIAEGLSAFAPEDASLDAGRVMLERLNELADARKDFAFETTLASRFYAGWLQKLKADGFRASMIFLWLRDAEFALERVNERVRLGGHPIPEETIFRRYERGLKNLFELYIPIVDEWIVYDASQEEPKMIARCTKIAGEEVFNRMVWNQIKR